MILKVTASGTVPELGVTESAALVWSVNVVVVVVVVVVAVAGVTMTVTEWSVAFVFPFVTFG